MSFALINLGTEFVVVDEDFVDGPMLVGEPVSVTVGGKKKGGTLFARGRKSEMLKEKTSAEGGKAPTAKRERKKRAPLFDAGSPPAPTKAMRVDAKVVNMQPVQVAEPDVEEEEEEEVAVEDEPIADADEDEELPSGADVTSLLQSLVRGQGQMLRELEGIKKKVQSLEANLKIAAESASYCKNELKTHKQQLDTITDGWGNLDSTLSTVLDRLPPKPKTAYTYLTESEVDDLDCDDDNVNDFAAKLEKAVFTELERCKSLKDREQRKVKWVLKIAMQRRQFSVDVNYEWVHGKLVESLNDRARKLKKKLSQRPVAQPSPVAPMTPPIPSPPSIPTSGAIAFAPSPAAQQLLFQTPAPPLPPTVPSSPKATVFVPPKAEPSSTVYTQL